MAVALQEIIDSDQGYWLSDIEGFSYFRSTPSKELIEDITIYKIDSEFKLIEIRKSKNNLKNCKNIKSKTS